MSRFSTIDAHHSALRDLERQRLERMMGQLRREVEGKEPPKGAAAPGPAPRFQPRRRAAAAAPRCGADAKPPAAPRGGAATPELEPAPAAGPAAAAAALANPERAGGGSVEMAWLWRASNRLQEDAEEVREFLTSRGLDRYAALLIDEPSGLGSSLEALRAAGEEALEQAGLPPSPRARLLQALQEPLPAPRPGSSRASTAPRGAATASQRGASPASGSRAAAVPAAGAAPPARAGRGAAGSPQERSSSRLDEGAEEKEDPEKPSHGRWGRLGRVPPGWRAGAVAGVPLGRPGGGPLRPHLVDTCCGEAEPLPPEAFEDALPTPSLLRGEGVTPAAAGAAAAAALAAARPARREVTGPQPSTPAAPSAPAVPAGRGRSLAGSSRPGTGEAAADAASRPGSSGGEKVCCYECFRKVFLQHAVEVEEPLPSPTARANEAQARRRPAVHFAARRFCGEDCAERFRRALAARGQRARELVELRNSVLGDCAGPDG